MASMVYDHADESICHFISVYIKGLGLAGWRIFSSPNFWKGLKGVLRGKDR